MPVPIILDCDPGHDDAVAMVLAHAHPAVDLLAVTTVGGNQSLEKCTLNARRVATAAGMTQVPVAAGEAGPLRRTLRVAEDVHGKSGLDGADLPEPNVDVVGEHAVELMRRILLDHPQPVTLVPTGPLTNIGLLLERHPEVKERIGAIVLMGGSTERGNATPYAEFNMWVDPEAAELVFTSGLDITMMGLNVTHQAGVTPDVIERLRALDTDLGRIFAGLLDFFADRYERLFGIAYPPLHDPVAVAQVIDPSLVEVESAPVHIETTGTYTSGATVVDLKRRTGRPDTARVGMRLDRGRFFDLVVEAVAACG